MKYNFSHGHFESLTMSSLQLLHQSDNLFFWMGCQHFDLSKMDYFHYVTLPSPLKKDIPCYITKPCLNNVYATSGLAFLPIKDGYLHHITLGLVGGSDGIAQLCQHKVPPMLGPRYCNEV